VDSSETRNETDLIKFFSWRRKKQAETIEFVLKKRKYFQLR